MAYVSKIKLPNNTEVNIKDSRIPGVDTEPTSGSDNVVTSGGVYTALSGYLPLSGGDMEDGAYIRLVEADGQNEYSTSISSSSVEINNEIDNYWTSVDGEFPGFTAASDVGSANEKTVTLYPDGILYKPSQSASQNLLHFPAQDGTLAVTSDIPSVDSSPTNGSSNAVSSGGVYTALSSKQDALVSGTNIKTINNESILGSGNITISGGGDTSGCVHKTGDETIGGDKTFTDNIEVVDASHIKYTGGGGGFTKGFANVYIDSSVNSISFTGLEGEPKAFIVTPIDAPATGANVISVLGDSTGLHGVYTTGTQHNYSAGFTASYANGTFTITAPTGLIFAQSSLLSLIYYYGDGTLTFKTSTIQPGSGATAVTFTGVDLTEIPAMYACYLESQVNSESYRRVALYSNACLDDDEMSIQVPTGQTFFSQQVMNTTSSFSISYNNGLNINSGGTNAGGYFHNPGTYTLYYLMASDIGGGGSGSYNSLKDELDEIRNTISGIETLLAAI